MKKTDVNSTHVEYEGVDLKEVEAVIEYLEKKHNMKLEEVSIVADGEFEDVHYKFKRTPFERIRRITGYLTGDVSQWNDAKVHELEDRLMHDVGMEDFGREDYDE